MSIEHSDTDDTVEMRINYSGERFDPLTEGEELSLSIVKRLAKETSFNFSTENEVTIRC